MVASIPQGQVPRSRRRRGPTRKVGRSVRIVPAVSSLVENLFENKDYELVFLFDFCDYEHLGCRLYLDLI